MWVPIIGMLTALRFTPVCSYLKSANWSLTYEVQMFGGGEITGGLLPDAAIPGELIDLNALRVAFEFDYAFDMAGRLRALSFDDGSGKHDRR